jgi:hypothetical protein
VTLINYRNTDALNGVLGLGRNTLTVSWMCPRVLAQRADTLFPATSGPCRQ